MFGFKLTILTLILSQLTDFVISIPSREPIISAIADFNSKFFLDTEINPENGKSNFIFSPFSISHVFSMIISSARGETQNELMKFFDYKDKFSTAKEVDNSYRSLLEQYDENESNKTERRIEMNFTSLALCQRNFSIKNDFKNNLKKNYKAEMREADFKSPEVLNEINDFVKNNTNGLIPKLFDKIDPKSVLVLANAFYFKGIWETKFSEIPEKKIFKNADGTTSQVKMMRVRSFFKYVEDEYTQTIEIPYSGDARIRIHLMKYIISNDQKIKKHRMIESLFKNGKKELLQMVTLILPQLKIEHSTNLKEELIKLGVDKLFNPIKSNLSGISEERLYVSSAIHKAYLEFNTKGTVAAAGSGIQIANSIAASREYFMIVDRPFIFDIYDKKNQLRLFTGKINKL